MGMETPQQEDTTPHPVQEHRQPKMQPAQPEQQGPSPKVNPLELEVIPIPTYQIGEWSMGRISALGSDSIVIWGMSKSGVPLALHQCSLEERRLRLLRQIGVLCQHEIHLNSVRLQGQDLLAVACGVCGDIKLKNFGTRETHVAYSSEEVPYRMCPGEADRIWLFCWRDHTVRELNCSSKTFTETGRTANTHYLFCWSLCYLPTPHKALALSYQDWMEAVSCETGQQLWKLEGEFEGKKLQPRGVTFHPELQLLLVADRVNDRIILVDPVLGVLVHSLTLQFGDNPLDFCWCRDQLILFHSLGLSTIRSAVPPKGTVRLEILIVFAVIFFSDLTRLHHHFVGFMLSCQNVGN